ncbi:MAG: MotA/TolQ/ExbB proton channel family protein, partial [Rikenellaceae bacterium]|nr:MotA/TolQ/ExbB proton channel family protein [Rikenellaceae bacterium]
MKKVSMFLAVAVFGTLKSFAQEAAAAATEVATEAAAVANEAAAVAIDAETEIAGDTMHQVLMQKFLEGGWGWMLPVLVCLVIGLAVAIERMLYLSFANINTKKFVAQFEETLNGQGVEAAK